MIHNCCNCLFEPEWDHESVTMVYNHRVLSGRCQFAEKSPPPPCHDIFVVCVVIPDKEDEEVRFGVNKFGSICYMKQCNSWKPSEDYLNILENEDGAGIEIGL